MSRNIFFIIVFLNYFFGLCAQNHVHLEVPLLVQGTGILEEQAVLQINSTDKGVLIPRMTAIQRENIIAPVNGLLVYDLDSSAFFYSKKAVWEKIGSASGLQGPEGPRGEQGVIGPAGTGGTSHTSGTNFLVGDYAGSILSSGVYNAFVGYSSGANISSGGFNTYLGGLSGSNNNGSNNVGIGYRAGGTVGQTGTMELNTSVGSATGAKLKDASYNTLIGGWAGNHLNFGNYNIMIGFATASGLNSSENNVYIGNTVANLNEDGSTNTIIGNNSGKNLTMGSSGNVFLGNQSGFSLGTSNQKLIIENSTSSRPLVYGDFTDDRVGVNWDWNRAIPNTFSVNGTASKTSSGDWLANSDKRLKTKITHLSSSLMLKKLLQMQGVSYEWNDNVTGFERPRGRRYGFLAQDIEMIWPENVQEDGQGYKMTSYGTYDYLYVESIKALHQENQLLKSEIETLNIRLQKIESLLSN